MSPRRLEGWEPAQYVDCVYGDDGRLVQAVVSREPEFSEDDVAALLALRVVQRDTGRYGESIEEATSAEADPNYYGDHAVRFIVSHVVNQAEAAVERYRKANEDAIGDGAVFRVETKRY